jgi:hypothetical protein
MAARSHVAPPAGDDSGTVRPKPTKGAGGAGAAAPAGEPPADQPPPPEQDTEAEEKLKAKAAEVADKARKANDAWLKLIGRWVLGLLSAAALAGLIATCHGRPWTAPKHAAKSAAKRVAHPVKKAAQKTTEMGWHAPWDLNPSHRAMAAAIVFVIGMLLLGSLLLRASGGLRRLLIGADGRFSTSQTTAALWTVALGFALAYLLLRDPFGAPNSDFAKSFKQLDTVYLLLLGVPYSALIVSRGITTAKVDNARLQKVTATESRLRDIFTDDDGHPALTDTQYAFFNVLALVYFVVAFAGSPTKLPDLPLGLVALTGVSGLAYTGTKAVASNAPAISTITRALGAGAIRPGDRVEIRGANFVPEGATEDAQLANVRVRFDNSEVPVIPHTKGGRAVNPTRTRLVVRVPVDVRAGECDVTVITAADLESPPFTMRVDVDHPVITGVRSGKVEAGGELVLSGRYFRRPGESGEPTVLFGDLPAQARVEGDALHVTVPRLLSNDERVTVRVVQADGTARSAPITLPIERS